MRTDASYDQANQHGDAPMWRQGWPSTAWLGVLARAGVAPSTSQGNCPPQEVRR